MLWDYPLSITKLKGLFIFNVIIFKKLSFAMNKRLKSESTD